MPKYIITDDHRKFDLQKADDLDISTRENHGTKITGVWKTKKGNVIVGVYSIWERDHSGEVVGQTYHVADADEIASLAREHDRPTLMDMVPLQE